MEGKRKRRMKGRSREDGIGEKVEERKDEIRWERKRRKERQRRIK